MTTQMEHELPGIATAFHEAAMRAHLQSALFGGSAAGLSVEACAPDKPLYVPGECCTVQYEVEARDASTGAALEAIVVGRVFPDRVACAEYMSRKLTPLLERARGRADLARFANLAAVIEPLDMIVHVWPIDGEMPTLVDATDPRRMVEVFRETLSSLIVESCEIERVSYRRRQRCVLRYTVRVRAADGGEPRTLVFYGKLTPYGEQALDGPNIERLREHLKRLGDRAFTVPRSLGWRQDLRLALLEAVPGEAKVGTAIRARLRGLPPSDAPPLEEMLATCARVAATLHSSGLGLGAERTIEHRLDDLRNEIAITRQFSPEYADRAQMWLDRVAAHARRTPALPHCLCHGDFKYAQLLFDRTGLGMVDLDRLCQAEPALDLGQFLAYLRTQIQKSQKRASEPSNLDDELAEHFFRAYLAAMGGRVEDERRLRERTALHEIASLMRVALHSSQKFKEARLDSTTLLIERRIEELPRLEGC